MLRSSETSITGTFPYRHIALANSMEESPAQKQTQAIFPFLRNPEVYYSIYHTQPSQNSP